MKLRLILKIPKGKIFFRNAQKSVDESCVKYINEFVPVAPENIDNSGSLRDSLKNPEPGKLIYTARFAPYTYYDETTRKNRGNPQGTRLWFEAMKSKYKARILAEAKKGAEK